MNTYDYIIAKAIQLYQTTGFSGIEAGNLIMIVIGLSSSTWRSPNTTNPCCWCRSDSASSSGIFPPSSGMALSVYDEGTVLRYLYFGVEKGVYPPLIFLGIGAMTDFSTMLSNPKLVLLGAAAQVGVFLTYLGALTLAFTPQEAGAIGIIGGADGPTAIFLSSRLAPELLGAIAIAAYSYMALVPVIQPPIMKLLTTRKERLIRMKPSRMVSRQRRLSFRSRPF